MLCFSKLNSLNNSTIYTISLVGEMVAYSWYPASSKKEMVAYTNVDMCIYTTI